MPPASKRPSPPARMVELLAAEKLRMLAEGRALTRQDFAAAWERSWTAMVDERAWAHKTASRRGWREAMEMTRSECQAAFLGAPSPYAHAAQALTAAAANMCVRLTDEQVPLALLAAHAYTETKEGEDVLAA